MTTTNTERKLKKKKRALEERECDFCRVRQDDVRTFDCCGIVSCEECTEMVACNNCLKEGCEECASVCECLGCERTFCEECEEFCDDCHKTLCIDHMFKLAVPEDGTRTRSLFCELCMLSWCRAFVRSAETPTTEKKTATSTAESLKTTTNE